MASVGFAGLSDSWRKAGISDKRVRQRGNYFLRNGPRVAEGAALALGQAGGGAGRFNAGDGGDSLMLADVAFDLLECEGDAVRLVSLVCKLVYLGAIIADLLSLTRDVDWMAGIPLALMEIIKLDIRIGEGDPI